jgi:hypothetical protein
VKIYWGGRGHGHVCGRPRTFLGSGRVMPGSRQTGEMRLAGSRNGASTAYPTRLRPTPLQQNQQKHQAHQSPAGSTAAAAGCGHQPPYGAAHRVVRGERTGSIVAKPPTWVRVLPATIRPRLRANWPRKKARGHSQHGGDRVRVKLCIVCPASFQRNEWRVADPEDPARLAIATTGERLWLRRPFATPGPICPVRFIAESSTRSVLRQAHA